VLKRLDNFDEVNGVYGYELPGGYVVATGGRHRITALLLENVPQIKMEIRKMKDPKEFFIWGEFKKGIIQKEIDEKDFKGEIIEDEENNLTRLILEKPLTTPLQMFDDRVSNELLDVLSQTL
jgi:hypothetical protein